MKNVIKKIAQISIGILLIAVLFLTISPGEIVSALSSVNPVYLIMAFILYSFTFLILTFRWQMIVEHMGTAIPLPVAYKAFAGGFLISDLTPGRIGDLSRALIVRDYVDLKKGTVSVLIDRYVDILTIAVLGFVGLLMLSSRFHNILTIGIFIILFTILVFTAIIVKKRSWRINFFKKNPYCRFSDLIEGIDTTLNSFQGDWRLFCKAFLLTLCAWITHAFRLILIGYSLKESLPFAQLFLLQPLVSALSIIPVTISGLGLVEGGLTLVLAELGIPAAYGLTIALLDRGITTFFHLVVGIKSATKVL